MSKVTQNSNWFIVEGLKSNDELLFGFRGAQSSVTSFGWSSSRSIRSEQKVFCTTVGLRNGTQSVNDTQQTREVQEEIKEHIASSR